MSAKRSVPREPQFPPKVADALKAASADAMLDPLVAQLMGRALATATARRLVKQAVDRGEELLSTPIRSTLLSLSEPMVAYAKAANLPIARMLGPWLPELWAGLLFSYLAEDAGISADEVRRVSMFPWNIERLTPENPIVRLDRDQDVWKGLGSSSPADRFMRDRYMSWERGVAPGRPRKTPGSPKARYTSAIRVTTVQIEEVEKSLASGDNWQVAAHKAGYCRRRHGAETRDGCDCNTTAAYAWVNFRRKLAAGSSGRPRQEK